MDKTAGKIQIAAARIIDSGTHISVASSTEFIAKKFGLSDRWVNYTHTELRNKLNELEYRKTPFKKRLLFLPHCMRNLKKCKAEHNDEGLQCKKCGNCKIGTLKQMSEDLGYGGCYTCPGGSMVQKIILKRKPQAVLGVCCFDEAQMAFDKLKGTGIAAQAVLLSRSGCRDTDVNIEEAREKMELIKR